MSREDRAARLHSIVRHDPPLSPPTHQLISRRRELPSSRRDRCDSLRNTRMAWMTAAPTMPAASARVPRNAIRSPSQSRPSCPMWQVSERFQIPSPNGWPLRSTENTKEFKTAEKGTPCTTVDKAAGRHRLLRIGRWQRRSTGSPYEAMVDRHSLGNYATQAATRRLDLTPLTPAGGTSRVRTFRAYPRTTGSPRVKPSRIRPSGLQDYDRDCRRGAPE